MLLEPMRPDYCNFDTAFRCVVSLPVAETFVAEVAPIIHEYQSLVPQGTSELFNPTDRQKFIGNLAAQTIKIFEKLKADISRRCLHCPLSKVVEVDIRNLLEPPTVDQ